MTLRAPSASAALMSGASGSSGSIVGMAVAPAGGADRRATDGAGLAVEPHAALNSATATSVTATRPGTGNGTGIRTPDRRDRGLDRVTRFRPPPHAPRCVPSYGDPAVSWARADSARRD